MAHVIGSYLEAKVEPWRIEVLPSYSSKSRVRWLWRFVASAAVLAFTPRGRIGGVHMHASHRFDLVRTLVLLELARLRRLPRILTLHGAELMDDVRRRPRLVRALLRRADVVTALSPEVEQAARGLGIERVVLLPNPVHLRPPPTRVADRTQVLFAGEIGRRKGVDVLVAAWPAVRDACPQLTLLLVGPVLEPDVIASLPEGAAYRGVLSRHEVAAALDASCLAVLPSRAEAMPMFVLEAMAAGVPVVGTPVGAVEAVVGDGGVVVPAGDAEALAGAMVGAVREPKRLDEMSRRAQQRIAGEFSSEIFERRVLELYDATFKRLNDLDSAGIGA